MSKRGRDFQRVHARALLGMEFAPGGGPCGPPAGGQAEQLEDDSVRILGPRAAVGQRSKEGSEAQLRRTGPSVALPQWKDGGVAGCRNDREEDKDAQDEGRGDHVGNEGQLEAPLEPAEAAGRNKRFLGPRHGIKAVLEDPFTHQITKIANTPLPASRGARPRARKAHMNGAAAEI